MVSSIVSETRGAMAEIVAINPAMIALHRDVETIVDEETVVTPTVLAPQLMTISEISNSQTDEIMEQGNIPTHIVNITAFFNTDILAKDRFVYWGKNYEIIFIRPASFGGQTDDCVYKKSGRAKEITEAVE